MRRAARSILVSLAAAALLLACREPIKCQEPTKACGELCCPAPEHGAAACDGAVCGFTCAAGFHKAGGACASDSSVTSCGQAAADCTAALPANSAAVCAGDPPACDFGCASGYHREGAACADDESVTSCGPLGADCTSGLTAHASPTCNGIACDFDCQSGFHKSGAECVDDDTLTSCGPSGANCTSGLPAHAGATCNGASCGFDCDSDYHKNLIDTSCDADTSVASCGAAASDCNTEKPANSAATCDGASCGFTCLDTFHSCDGVSCSSNFSTTTCGTSCGTPCSAPANGSPTCDGTSCGFDCNSDSHKNLIGTACDADTSVSSCGATASDCNTEKPANSAATCSGTSCGFTCLATFHSCDNTTCSSNFSTATCGTSCGTPCTAPANGTPTCSGTSCGFDCNSDFHKTGSTCTGDGTVSSCGQAARDCNTEAPAHSSANCNGTSCGFDCNSDYYKSGSTCAPNVTTKVADSKRAYCTDASQEVSCPVPSGQPGYGQDGNYLINVPTYTQPETTDTVVDSVTGLMWEKRNPLRSGTHAEAIAACENMSFANHDDWRLPTRFELHSIMDYGPTEPTIDPVFGYARCESYTRTWTSSVRTEGAWTAYFVVSQSWGGGLYPLSVEAGACYRCVRGPQATGGAWVDEGEVVRDTRTGLMWEEQHSSSEMNWLTALAHCEGRMTGGYQDWRLPNFKELYTLVDDSRSNPAIDPLFPMPATTSFWSSTPVAAYKHYAFRLDFSTLSNSDATAATSYWVRCVR